MGIRKKQTALFFAPAFFAAYAVPDMARHYPGWLWLSNGEIDELGTVVFGTWSSAVVRLLQPGSRACHTNTNAYPPKYTNNTGDAIRTHALLFGDCARWVQLMDWGKRRVYAESSGADPICMRDRRRASENEGLFMEQWFERYGLTIWVID